MRQAEEAEQQLSYISPCGTEAARKMLGSYYTPMDVSLFFWNEFLTLTGVEDHRGVAEFWGKHHFIEPAAGAGILIFALLKKGGELGLSLRDIASIELTIIDINPAALDFVKGQMSWLESRWGITFRKACYVCKDFREWTIPVKSRTPMLFGNPPFVANPSGSKWKNLFADFLDRSINQAGKQSQCHFILPLSIAFSRDYARLRKQMRQTGKSIALSSFDNIPDTLFPSGKPEHTNTNKANSQRCTILTVFTDKKPIILSTRIHRWAKAEREFLLSTHPRYEDVTNYDFDDQFPRPEHHFILQYFEEAKHAQRLNTLVCERGNHCLYVSTVARNFIGFRENDSSNVHILRFSTHKVFYSVLLILSSDLYFDYWLSLIHI